jgi:hypothetical protein
MSSGVRVSWFLITNKTGRDQGIDNAAVGL